MDSAKNWIPSPLAIAFLLLFFVALMAILFFQPENVGLADHAAQVFEHAYGGMWGEGGLSFLVQMALMLVLGHILALSSPVQNFIGRILSKIHNSRTAVICTCLVAMLAGFINWGFGLILGAVFAKAIMDHFSERKIPHNAALIAACGYTGLLVWHGGISGSSLIKVAEPGHLASLAPELFDGNQILDASKTIFNPINLLVFLVVLGSITACALWLSKKAPPLSLATSKRNTEETQPSTKGLDGNFWVALIIGVMVLIGSVYLICTSKGGLSFLNPNYINFTLLGLGILMHKSLNRFSEALEQAISGSSGILIQFPIYFAIMGIMGGSGMVSELANFFVEHASQESLPLFTFFSAGLINLFVPSGGGQWMIQGPIIIESCQQLGIPLEKGVLALAYGDQLTNMLQPFWALPLLGITKVKASQLLPFTFYFFLVGLVVYGLSLLVS
ncbi:MAG: TIGR00366 family protein [Luteibaculum sp.]